MKVDAPLPAELADVADGARSLEAAGFDGVLSVDTAHDPFLPLAVAAGATERVDLGTSIAVAFARSPMTIAQQAHDLQRYSRGRFRLGLGSQVKPHIERRFSMPWSHPAARMRELILAVRAIWRCWNEGIPLEFRGEFYTHTLMTPFFHPGPSGFAAPPILLAAVGEAMSEVAGEVADGIILHGFTTERYVRERTLPAVHRGLERAGRDRSSFTVVHPGFVVSGRDEKERLRRDAEVRAQLAFYGSTPAYRPVLALHGWEDLAGELNTLSRRGRWEEMAALVDDEVLEAFAVVAEPGEVADRMVGRYGELVDRFQVGSIAGADPAEWAPVARRLRDLAAARA